MTEECEPLHICCDVSTTHISFTTSYTFVLWLIKMYCGRISLLFGMFNVRNLHMGPLSLYPLPEFISLV